MNETSFTKGPWVIESGDEFFDGPCITSKERKGVLNLCMPSCEYFDDAEMIEQKHNTYLIAAAPEMYEMLEAVISEMFCLIDEVNDQRMSRVTNLTETPPDLHDQETLHNIQLLLAKARGEGL